jgi:ATP-dependent Zn protease
LRQVNRIPIYARAFINMFMGVGVLKAKGLFRKLRRLALRYGFGPPEDVEYIERERHAVAIHEACHAVVTCRTRQHMEIDIATIEKGSDYLGMVASIPPEDQFTRWRSEFETDILVSLASLAGEQMFFDSDSSSGVSGDLESATTVASFMEGFWGWARRCRRIRPRSGLRSARPASPRRAWAARRQV